MGATLLTQLPSTGKPIFAGNLPDLTFSGIDPEEGMKLVVSIRHNGSAAGDIILDEIIFGDVNNTATVKIKAVVEASLKYIIPSSNIFEQSLSNGSLFIYYDNLATELRVVKGGIFIPDNIAASFDYDTFFITNFLTWMPAERHVKYREPLFINYFNRVTGSAQLYVKSYWIDNNTLQSAETPIYNGLSINTMYCFNVTFHQLITESGEGRGVFAFDLYVKGASGKLTNTHRITLINDFDEYDDVFAYSNSVGGFETIRYTGILKENEKHQPLTYRSHNNHLIEFENVIERTFIKNTGFFDTEAQRKWLREFFTSDFRHHIRFTETGFVYERIAIISQKAEGARYLPNSYEFEFKYANQVPWQFFIKDTLLPVNAGEAVIPSDVGDLPDSQFSSDFLNQTPLIQFIDETLST